jgi:S-adenosylmethionine synthetase
MGRVPEVKNVVFRDGSGTTMEMEVETFTWEKLDHVGKIKDAFRLS